MEGLIEAHQLLDAGSGIDFRLRPRQDRLRRLQVGARHPARRERGAISLVDQARFDDLSDFVERDRPNDDPLAGDHVDQPFFGKSVQCEVHRRTPDAKLPRDRNLVQIGARRVGNRKDTMLDRLVGLHHQRRRPLRRARYVEARHRSVRCEIVGFEQHASVLGLERTMISARRPAGVGRPGELLSAVSVLVVADD